MEDKNSKGKDSENPEIKRIMGIVLLIGAFLLIVFGWISSRLERRVLKSEIAKGYGISTKKLMNWVRLTCPEDVRQKYVGTKVKKIKPSELYCHIGKPKDRPKDKKGRLIRDKDEISWTLNIVTSTLKRRLQEIENPEEVIGMSYESFAGMRKELPPRQVELILVHMVSKGYPKKGGSIPLSYLNKQNG